MAGTVTGGRATAITNKERYGADFYKRIGSKGGTRTYESGKLARVNFANDTRTTFEKLMKKPTRAQLAGQKGGKISKRRSKVALVAVAEPPTRVMPAPRPRKRPGGYYKPIVSVIPPHNTFYVFIPDKES